MQGGLMTPIESGDLFGSEHRTAFGGHFWYFGWIARVSQSFTIKGLRLPAVGNNLALDQQRGCSAGIA